MTRDHPATSTRGSWGNCRYFGGGLVVQMTEGWSPNRGRNEDGRNGKRTGNTGQSRSLQVNNVTRNRTLTRTADAPFGVRRSRWRSARVSCATGWRGSRVMLTEGRCAPLWCGACRPRWQPHSTRQPSTHGGSRAGRSCSDYYNPRGRSQADCCRWCERNGQVNLRR